VPEITHASGRTSLECDVLKTGKPRHQLPRIVLINFGVLSGLYLLVEMALHIFSSEDLMHSGNRDFNGGRADWTFDAKASGYGSMGVEGAIQKAKQQMSRLHQTLSRHGIALSVGVYPWPQ
jgi:hypothetical protein